MYLEQLRYFLATANVHSMRKASEIMHISQQNISKAILSLEEELQVKLFTRTRSGVFLTEEGQSIYLLAKELCATEQKILDFSKNQTSKHYYEQITGNFIALTIPGYAPLVYDTFYRFKKLCPKLNLFIEERESLDAFKYLLKHQLEFAILTVDNDFQTFENAWFWNTYNVHVLQQNNLKIMTTVSSPLVQYQSISNKQIEDHLSVIYATGSTSETLISNLLKDNGINSSTLFYSNSQAACREALINQSAIMISSDMVFSSALKMNIDELILLPMTQKISVTHIYVIKKDLTPTGQLFYYLLQENFEKIGLIPEQLNPLQR